MRVLRAIDLFAGLGGFTLGAQLAGVEVVWASNHWDLIVRTHAANHPDVIHVCQDLRQADFSRIPDYDLLLASPCCQGGSQAGRPGRKRDPRVAQRHDEYRSTAWAVVDCAEATRPRAFIVENIPDMRDWELYPVWKLALQTLGYALTELKLLATDFGVPQLRSRLFIVGMLGERAFDFCPPPPARPAFGPCIDWDAPGWRPVAQARPKARERIRAAQARRGLRRLLVQHVTGHPGVPLDEPIRTITTKDQWVVVDGDRYRWLTMRELARAQSFPDSYLLPDASREEVVRGIGNAVPSLVVRGLVRQVANDVGRATA